MNNVNSSKSWDSATKEFRDYKFPFQTISTFSFKRSFYAFVVLLRLDVCTTETDLSQLL